MLLKGKWDLCLDGVVRPVLRGEAEAGNGAWVGVPFLVDTGADRTLFSADVLRQLALPPLDIPEGLSGVGGTVQSVVVETRLQFPKDDGAMVVFRGWYAGTPDEAALDMSVLGRDITSHFALI